MELLGQESVEIERFLFGDANVIGAFSRDRGGAGVNVIAGLGNREARYRNGKI